MWSVEEESAFVSAVVEDHIEAAAQRYDDLLEFFVCVSAAGGAAWHVIEVVDSFYREGYLSVLFDEGEVASKICYLWKINDFTLA